MYLASDHEGIANSEVIEHLIEAREHDLGGFTVRRLLPYALRRMVGPFIFFDHMGPAVFTPGKGMDVRPHPHINLATVTYLFDGQIRHRDSLGFNQLINPGDINWMTAGRGIVHSERTPAESRHAMNPLHGIQLWVALPTEAEETAPSFTHYPSNSLPTFSLQNSQLKLLLGSAFGRTSPVAVHSGMFYLEVNIPQSEQLRFPVFGCEAAVYVIEGGVRIDGQMVSQRSMAIARLGDDMNIEATESSRLVILGGEPLGERFIYWNFVSSSRERIEVAKREWLAGPRSESTSFSPIPDDDSEFIPLPDEPNPKGTIM